MIVELAERLFVEMVSVIPRGSNGDLLPSDKLVEKMAESAIDFANMFYGKHDHWLKHGNHDPIHETCRVCGAQNETVKYDSKPPYMWCEKCREKLVENESVSEKEKEGKDETE